MQTELEGADFVQEWGPERLVLKRELFAELDEKAAPDAILASSSAGLAMIEMALQLRIVG